MVKLNIYIQDEDAWHLFPIIDYAKNVRQNDYYLFFLKKKYPGLHNDKNVMVCDFPAAVTDEWCNTLSQFACKINADAVTIHTPVHCGKSINFPLLQAFRQKAQAFRLAFCLYETRIADAVFRQELNKLLYEGLDVRGFSQQLKRKVTHHNAEWSPVYNYLFNALVNTTYYLSDFHRNTYKKFFAAPQFRYWSQLLNSINADAAAGALRLLGVDNIILDSLREINEKKKTLFFVDDGEMHLLGHEGKGACLQQEIDAGSVDYIVILNSKGSIPLNVSGANVIALPDNITFASLLLAGIAPRNVYGFPVFELFLAPAKSIQKIFFHEHENFSENATLGRYLALNGFAKKTFRYVNETQRKIAGNYFTKHIFLLAESMGDVLFAAGALNALRDRLEGSFICIVPKIYHDLLSLCPWVDELWEPQYFTQQQAEDIYIAQQLGQYHLPSHVKHILDKKHQIDSFVDAFEGEPVDDSRKSIVLSLDALDKRHVDAFMDAHGLTRAEKIVLVHPNVGVPNRTWPQQYWEALIARFVDDGWSVVLIGSNTNFYSHKKALEIENAAVVNAIDRFTILETAYLMTQATLLVACDSGPVALAGATDIAICALYSVVPGEYRLPWRYGEQGWNSLAVDIPCSYYHCASSYRLGSNEKFDEWCPNNRSYTCMSGFKPDDFYSRIQRFITSERFFDRRVQKKRSPAE